MRIQIDTKEKSIKVMENVKFSDLLKALDEMFPNLQWKDYTLQAEHGSVLTQYPGTVTWPNIIQTDPYPHYTIPCTNPTVICWDTGGTTVVSHPQAS